MLKHRRGGGNEKATKPNSYKKSGFHPSLYLPLIMSALCFLLPLLYAIRLLLKLQ